LSARSFHGLAMSVCRSQQHVPRLTGENSKKGVAMLPHARASGIGLHRGIARSKTTHRSIPPCRLQICASRAESPECHIAASYPIPSDASLDDSASDDIETCAPGVQHAFMKPRIPPWSLVYFSILPHSAPSPI